MLRALADMQHAIWSHWMRYMFTQGTLNPDGSWTMPQEKVGRWMRQMTTDFEDLTEKEQVSDFDQATKVMSVVLQHAWELMPRAGIEE